MKSSSLPPDTDILITLFFSLYPPPSPTFSQREHYSDEGAKKLNQNRSREDQEWAELSNRDKALTWAKENKFGVVAGR